MILALSFIFSTGCTKYIEVPVYIEGKCPRIEVLKSVDLIAITVDSNGSIVSQGNVDNLLKGASQLRKSEVYYEEQLTKYNKEFVDK